MSFGDRIRAFFSRRSNPQLEGLASFAADRKGVEGYIEPRTATSPVTLLLVDRDGDHSRAAVRDPADAVAFCERLGIPVYTFNQWLAAKRTNDAQLQEMLVRRFSPEYRTAFAAWLKTAPFTTPSAPPGPAYMPEYHNPSWSRPNT